MCFYVYSYRALLLLPPPEGSPIDPVQTTRNHISRHLIARNAEILQQLLPDAIVASVSLWPPTFLRAIRLATDRPITSAMRWSISRLILALS